MVSDQSRLLADGHVHIYGQFDRAAMFRTALRNFSNVAAARGLREGGWMGCLLFTESARDSVFAELAASEGREVAPGWVVHRQEESECLRVIHREHGSLLLIGGFQVATVEDLEVLAIGTTQRVPDGQEFGKTIAAVRATGAFPVIPWGFGKWSLNRGVRVRQVIEQSPRGSIAFGDNGGRLGMFARPALLDVAAQAGFPIVPGTDPLPFPGQELRVGSNGFEVGSETAGGPAARIRAALAGSPAALKGYVSLTSAPAFVLTQVRMQMKKRLG
jgi:hypothetical protein